MRGSETKCYENLSIPIGIAFSTLCIQTEFKLSAEKERRMLAYATCLVAFAESYLTPESDWGTSILNKITVQGHEHYLKAALERERRVSGGDQAELEDINEKYIDKTLVLCRNNFDLELFQPFIIGQLLSKDASVPNLEYGCKCFFRKHKYCLVTVEGLYFLIWKRYGMYFVFDPNSRNTNLKIDVDYGYNVMMAMPSLHNVNCLIIKLSGLKPNDIYTIRRIKVKILLPFIPTNTVYKRIRKMEYEIIDNQHALLKGHVPLEMLESADSCGKVDNVIAIIAILMAKIDLPSTWDGCVIDEIIILSNSKYKSWIKQNGTKQLKIQSIPTSITLGIFNVKFHLSPCEMCGTWSYVPNYRFSGLTIALKKILPDSSNIIIEIAGRFYPLWKRNEYFYVLDVYQHGGASSPGVVHMCSTLNSLSCVLHYNILELLSPTDFIIHKVVVIEILRKDQCKLDLDKLTMLYEPNVESVSLNESIEDIEWTVDLNSNHGDYCQDEFQNLDGDGLSMTQIPPNYQSQRNALGDMEEIESEGDGEEEEEEEDEESGSDLDSGGAGDGTYSSKQKGGKSKGSKSKGGQGKGGKGKAKRDKKGKSKREDSDESESDDDKKGKGKKGKEKGKKGQKEKEAKEKKEKASKEKKEKAPKEKKEKESKETKEKEPKEKKEKESKEKKEKESKEKKEKESKEKKEKEAKDKKEKDSKDKKEKDSKEKKEKDSKEKKEKDSKEKKGKEAKDKKDKDMKAKEQQDKTGRDKDKMAKGQDDKMGKSRDKDGKDTGRSKDGRGDGRVFGPGDSDFDMTSQKADEDRQRFSLSLTNSYPGYTCIPYNIAVVGSESGSPESILNLLQTGLKVADRVLLMSPWGKFVIFRYGDAYLIYDGCTCDVERFRHLDLTKGTAGLIVHYNLETVVEQIISNQVENVEITEEHILNEIIEEYGQ